MSVELIITIIGIGIIGIETVFLIAVPYITRRLFGWSKSTCLAFYFVISYPGTFLFGKDWFGIGFPVPFLIGGPIWLVSLFVDHSPQGTFSWFPALSYCVSSFGHNTPAFDLAAVYEMGGLLLWALISRKVLVRMRKGPDAPQ